MTDRRMPGTPPILPSLPSRPPEVGGPERWDGEFDPELWPVLADGRIALQGGRLDEAERAARVALRRLRPRPGARSRPPASAVGSGSVDGDGRASARTGRRADDRGIEVLAARGSAHALLSLVHRERGETSDAEREFREAVDAFEAGGTEIGRGVVSFAHGVVLLYSGRAEDACEVLRRAFDQGEDTPDQRRYYAIALRDAGHPRDAYDHLLRSAPRAPHDWRAWDVLVELGDTLGDVPTADRVDARLRGAHAYARARRYDDALRLVSSAHELDPTPDLLDELARAQARAGLPDDALASLDALAASEPLSPDARMLRAEVLEQTGRSDEAVAEALAVGAVGPEGTDLLERRAALLLSAERWDDVLVCADTLDETRPDAAVRYRIRALVGLGREHEAEEAARDALATELDAPDLHALLGWTVGLQGEVEEALQELEKALALDPHDHWARVLRAQALWSLDHQEVALYDLGRLVQERPDDTFVRYVLGDLLRQRGDLDAAEQHLRAALDLDPTSGPLWESLASLLQDRGEREASLDAWRHAVTLAPTSVSALVGAAELAIDAVSPDRPDEADDLLARALAVAPESPVVHALLGELARRREQWEVALGHLDRAVALAPEYAWALGTRGQVYAAVPGRLPDAVRDLVEADRLERDQPWVLAALADAYVDAEDLGRADEVLGRLTVLQPHVAAWWLVRARVLLALGRPDRAEPVLREALDAVEDPAEVRNELADLLVTDDRPEAAVEVVEGTPPDEADDRLRLTGAKALANLGESTRARDALLALVGSEEVGVDAAAVLGEVCRIAGWYGEAEHWLGVAFDGVGDEASAWLRGSRGALRRATGDLAGAEADFRAALAQQADNAFALAQLADLLVVGGRVDEGLALVADVAEPSVDLRAMHGFLLRQVGRLDEALDVLHDALWASPDSAMVLRILGGALVAARRSDEAVEHLNRAVEVSRDAPAPERVDVAVDLVDALIELGRLDEAWETSLSIVRTLPDEPQGWVALSVTASQTASWETSRVAAERATRTPTQRSTAYRELGRAWLSSGGVDGAEHALEAYATALRLDAGDLWTRRGRADALFAVGRLDDARTQYEDVLAQIRSGPVPDWRLCHLDGWCQLRTGRLSAAVRSLQTVTLEAPFPASAFLDLALTTLVGDTAAQAVRYAQRGLDELDREPPRMRRGTLRTALQDVESTRPLLPTGTARAVDDYRERLLTALRAVDDTDLRLPDDPAFTTLLRGTG